MVTPTPGFEPGIPEGNGLHILSIAQDFETVALPDSATLA